MNNIPDQLSAIIEKVQKGERPKVTVRTLLSWFDQHRRGQHIVSKVRMALEQIQIKTEPDFELAFFDGPVEFQSLSESNQRPVAEPASSKANKGIQNQSTSDSKLPKDPVMRVDILEAANKKNASINQTPV